MSGRARRWIAAALLPAALSGCTLAQLRAESREVDRVSVLMGHVVAPAGWCDPVVVAATTRAVDRVVVAAQTRLHEPGGYELLVSPGAYTLLAYGDRNGNGRLDRGEPAALFADTVTTAGRHMIMDLDLQLQATATDAVRRALPEEAPLPPPHSTQVGAIARLDDALFSPEHGSAAYWTPIADFRSSGGNIYFLEPHDPTRTPVLFVHGASGSPQDWRYFFEHLDRRKYQAWFFQYPSGAPLDAMAHLLHWKLANVQARYSVPRLHVVAHSMGGLVVQRFLADHAEHFPEIREFVTISTPWDGEPRATLGVKYSPAVVPSWRDLQPEGAFVASLFEQPLGGNVRHSLLFGHRGGPRLWRPTSDGTVTLASQLKPEAQQRARVVMGFDEDHTSILSSPRVLHAVTRLLDDGSPE